MLDALQAAQGTQCPVTYGSQGRAAPARQGKSCGDTLAISEEGRAAWQASQKKQAEAADESLRAELKKYVDNPVLAHALDKMEEAIGRMGYDKRTEEIVLEQVQAAFRSGLPAKGQQTDDTMSALSQSVKELTGLEDEDMAALTQELGVILAEAQDEEARRGKKAGEKQLKAS